MRYFVLDIPEIASNPTILKFEKNGWRVAYN